MQEITSASIGPDVAAMMTKQISQEMIKASAKLISGWRSLLSLHKWLSQNTEAGQFIVFFLFFVFDRLFFLPFSLL